MSDLDLSNNPPPFWKMFGFFFRYLKQEKLLISQGVKFVNGKIVPVATDKGKELDEVLWGPKGS